VADFNLAMEGTMQNTQTEQAVYPTVDFVLSSIAAWVKHHRNAVQNRELWECSPDQVNAVAKDIGMSPSDLRAIAGRGPRAADLLKRLLVALDIDPAKLAIADPASLRDMQRLCSACRSKGRCENEFAHGTAAADFRDYCPNAYTLDALLAATTPVTAR
jgi:hypothetical protein